MSKSKKEPTVFDSLYRVLGFTSSGETSESKQVQSPLADELAGLLNSLQVIRTTRNQHLKLPQLTPISIQGISDLPTETTGAGSGFESAEAKRLWNEMDSIMVQLSRDYKQISDSKPEETERLRIQIELVKDALAHIRRNFDKIQELDMEFGSFLKDKRRQYALKRDEALRIIGTEPLNPNLKPEWRAAKSIIEKEFSVGQPEPSSHDYANLLIAVKMLKELPREVELSEGKEPRRQKRRRKPVQIKSDDSEEPQALMVENRSLATKISQNLKFLRQLETTQWKELDLPLFRQNNALQELGELYRAASGDESEKQGTFNSFLTNLSVRASDTFQQILGVDVKEAAQLKMKIDEIFLRCENDIKALGRESNILQTSRIKEVNRLLKEQDAILQKMINEVLPLYSQIEAIDKALIAFKDSGDKEQLYAAKKNEFYDDFEMLLEKTTALESQLKARLNDKHGPAIGELNRLLIEKMQQVKDAKRKIDSVTNPGLKEYAQLLNNIFALKGQAQEIELLIESIEAKISQQKEDNEVRREYAQKMAVLYKTYHGLKSPHTEFKDKKLQEDALAKLEPLGENFELGSRLVETHVGQVEKEYQQRFAEVPLDEIKQRLGKANQVIRNLSYCLSQAKITEKVAKANFQYFVNSSGSKIDPEVVQAVRRLAEGDGFAGGEFTGTSDQVRQLRDVLSKQDFVIIDENFSITDSEEDLFQETIRFWPREKLVAYCKSIAEFTKAAFDGGIHDYASNVDFAYLSSYHEAMAFKYERDLTYNEPLLFVGKVANYFSAVSGHTEEELDEQLTAIYRQIPSMLGDFQAQFPKIDSDTVSNFMREVNFSDDLKGIDDEEMLTLLRKQNSGELHEFLAAQIQIYTKFQPTAGYSDTVNLDEIAQLRKSRNYIAKAYKLHWLSALHKEGRPDGVKANRQFLSFGFGMLSNDLNKLSLESFLDHSEMASFAERFTRMQNERIYGNLCQFYHTQEIFLGRKNPIDRTDQDWSDKPITVKITEIKEKIRANQADCQSTPLALGLPKDFVELYKRNKSFLDKGINFQFNPIENFEEDAQIIQELSDPSWLEMLEQPFRETLATEPSSDEICIELLNNLDGLSRKIDDLSRFYRKLQRLEAQRKEIIGEMLKSYPSHEQPSGFFGKVLTKQWQQIERALLDMPEEENNLHLDQLQKRTVRGVLNDYRKNRKILIKAQDEGFDPKVDYQKLLSSLVNDKQVLDAALVFHEKIEAKRLEKLGDLPEKLSKGIKILDDVYGRVRLMLTTRQNNNEAQERLVRDVMSILNEQKLQAAVHLNDLQLTSPYNETLDTKAEEARAFLDNLPYILSTQVANEELYNQLDVVGKDTFERIVDLLKEAIEGLCNALGIEFKDDKLSSAYKKELGNLVSDIQNSKGDEEASSSPQL